MLDIIKIIILGAVEGVTEWLPISSTGHLILVGNLLQPSYSDAFMHIFNVLVQLGAILAVILVFFNKLWPFHTGAKRPARSQFAHPVSGGFAGSFQNFADNYLYMNRIVIWIKMAISSMPALVLGALFEEWLEVRLHAPIPVAVMLILFGVIFIIVENKVSQKPFRVNNVGQITWTLALFIGCFQALALFPGTSRSGVTIIGALILGLSRVCAAEYSFYLAIPAMVGASIITLLHTDITLAGGEIAALLLGMAVAFVVSLFIVRFLMSFVSKHTFKPFAWYRIVLGGLVIVVASCGLI